MSDGQDAVPPSGKAKNRSGNRERRSASQDSRGDADHNSNLLGSSVIVPGPHIDPAEVLDLRRRNSDSAMPWADKHFLHMAYGRDSLLPPPGLPPRPPFGSQAALELAAKEMEGQAELNSRLEEVAREAARAGLAPHFPYDMSMFRPPGLEYSSLRELSMRYMRGERPPEGTSVHPAFFSYFPTHPAFRGASPFLPLGLHPEAMAMFDPLRGHLDGLHAERPHKDSDRERSRDGRDRVRDSSKNSKKEERRKSNGLPSTDICENIRDKDSTSRDCHSRDSHSSSHSRDSINRDSHSRDSHSRDSRDSYTRDSHSRDSHRDLPSNDHRSPPPPPHKKSHTAVMSGLTEHHRTNCVTSESPDLELGERGVRDIPCRTDSVSPPDQTTPYKPGRTPSTSSSNSSLPTKKTSHDVASILERADPVHKGLDMTSASEAKHKTNLGSSELSRPISRPNSSGSSESVLSRSSEGVLPSTSSVFLSSGPAGSNIPVLSGNPEPLKSPCEEPEPPGSTNSAPTVGPPGGNIVNLSTGGNHKDSQNSGPPPVIPSQPDPPKSAEEATNTISTSHSTSHSTPVLGKFRFNSSPLRGKESPVYRALNSPQRSATQGKYSCWPMTKKQRILGNMGKAPSFYPAQSVLDTPSKHVNEDPSSPERHTKKARLLQRTKPVSGLFKTVSRDLPFFHGRYARNIVKSAAKTSSALSFAPEYLPQSLRKPQRARPKMQRRYMYPTRIYSLRSTRKKEEDEVKSLKMGDDDELDGEEEGKEGKEENTEKDAAGKEPIKLVIVGQRKDQKKERTRHRKSTGRPVGRPPKGMRKESGHAENSQTNAEAASILTSSTDCKGAIAKAATEVSETSPDKVTAVKYDSALLTALKGKPPKKCGFTVADCKAEVPEESKVPDTYQATGRDVVSSKKTIIKEGETKDEKMSERRASAIDGVVDSKTDDPVTNDAHPSGDVIDKSVRQPSGVQMMDMQPKVILTKLSDRVVSKAEGRGNTSVGSWQGDSHQPKTETEGDVDTPSDSCRSHNLSSQNNKKSESKNDTIPSVPYIVSQPCVSKSDTQSPSKVPSVALPSKRPFSKGLASINRISEMLMSRQSSKETVDLGDVKKDLPAPPVGPVTASQPQSVTSPTQTSQSEAESPRADRKARRKGIVRKIVRAPQDDSCDDTEVSVDDIAGSDSGSGTDTPVRESKGKFNGSNVDKYIPLTSSIEQVSTVQSSSLPGFTRPRPDSEHKNYKVTPVGLQSNKDGALGTGKTTEHSSSGDSVAVQADERNRIRNIDSKSIHETEDKVSDTAVENRRKRKILGKTKKARLLSKDLESDEKFKNDVNIDENFKIEDKLKDGQSATRALGFLDSQLLDGVLPMAESRSLSRTLADLLKAKPEADTKDAGGRRGRRQSVQVKSSQVNTSQLGDEESSVKQKESPPKSKQESGDLKGIQGEVKEELNSKNMGKKKSRRKMSDIGHNKPPSLRRLLTMETQSDSDMSDDVPLVNIKKKMSDDHLEPPQLDPVTVGPPKLSVQVKVPDLETASNASSDRAGEGGKTSKKHKKNKKSKGKRKEMDSKDELPKLDRMDRKSENKSILPPTEITELEKELLRGRTSNHSQVGKLPESANIYTTKKTRAMKALTMAERMDDAMTDVAPALSDNETEQENNVLPSSVPSVGCSPTREPQQNSDTEDTQPSTVRSRRRCLSRHPKDAVIQPGAEGKSHESRIGSGDDLSPSRAKRASRSSNTPKRASVCEYDFMDSPGDLVIASPQSDTSYSARHSPGGSREQHKRELRVVLKKIHGDKLESSEPRPFSPEVSPGARLRYGELPSPTFGASPPHNLPVLTSKSPSDVYEERRTERRERRLSHKSPGRDGEKAEVVEEKVEEKVMIHRSHATADPVFIGSPSPPPTMDAKRFNFTVKDLESKDNILSKSKEITFQSHRDQAVAPPVLQLPKKRGRKRKNELLALEESSKAESSPVIEEETPGERIMPKRHAKPPPRLQYCDRGETKESKSTGAYKRKHEDSDSESDGEEAPKRSIYAEYSSDEDLPPRPMIFVPAGHMTQTTTYEKVTVETRTVVQVERTTSSNPLKLKLKLGNMVQEKMINKSEMHEGIKEVTRSQEVRKVVKEGYLSPRLPDSDGASALTYPGSRSPFSQGSRSPATATSVTSTTTTTERYSIYHSKGGPHQRTSSVGQYSDSDFGSEASHRMSEVLSEESKPSIKMSFKKNKGGWKSHKLATPGKERKDAVYDFDSDDEDFGAPSQSKVVTQVAKPVSFTKRPMPKGLSFAERLKQTTSTAKRQMPIAALAREEAANALAEKKEIDKMMVTPGESPSQVDKPKTKGRRGRKPKALKTADLAPPCLEMEMPQVAALMPTTPAPPVMSPAGMSPRTPRALTPHHGVDAGLNSLPTLEPNPYAISQHKAQKSPHTTQHSSHLVQHSPQVPQHSPYMPQPSPLMPQQSPHMPQQSPHMPHPSPHMPQPSPHMPQQSPHMPQPSPHMPQPSPHMPQASPYLPQASSLPQPSPQMSSTSPAMSHQSPHPAHRSPSRSQTRSPRRTSLHSPPSGLHSPLPQGMSPVSSLHPPTPQLQSPPPMLQSPAPHLHSQLPPSQMPHLQSPSSQWPSYPHSHPSSMPNLQMQSPSPSHPSMALQSPPPHLHGSLRSPGMALQSPPPQGHSLHTPPQQGRSPGAATQLQSPQGRSPGRALQSPLPPGRSPGVQGRSPRTRSPASSQMYSPITPISSPPIQQHPPMVPPLPWQSPAEGQPRQANHPDNMDTEPELPELPLNDTLDTLRKLEMLYKPARTRQLQQQVDSSDEVRRLRIPSSKFMPQPQAAANQTLGDYEMPEFSSSSGSESEGEEGEGSGAESGAEDAVAPTNTEVPSHDTSPESGVDTKTPVSDDKPPSSVEEAKASPEPSTAHRHGHHKSHSEMSIRFPGLPCEEDCQCCQNESLPDLLRKLQESVDINAPAPDDLAFLNDVDLFSCDSGISDSQPKNHTPSSIRSGSEHNDNPNSVPEQANNFSEVSSPIDVNSFLSSVLSDQSAVSTPPDMLTPPGGVAGNQDQFRTMMGSQIGGQLPQQSSLLEQYNSQLSNEAIQLAMQQLGMPVLQPEVGPPQLSSPPMQPPQLPPVLQSAPGPPPLMPVLPEFNLSDLTTAEMQFMQPSFIENKDTQQTEQHHASSKKSKKKKKKKKEGEEEKEKEEKDKSDKESPVDGIELPNSLDLLFSPAENKMDQLLTAVQDGSDPDEFGRNLWPSGNRSHAPTVINTTMWEPTTPSKTKPAHRLSFEEMEAAAQHSGGGMNTSWMSSSMGMYTCICGEIFTDNWAYQQHEAFCTGGL